MLPLILKSFKDIKEVDKEGTLLAYLNPVNTVYEVYCEGELYAYLGLFANRPTIELHFEVIQFNKKFMKHTIKLFKDFEVIAREGGFTTLLASKYEETKVRDKWTRFISHFGFKKLQQVRIAVKEV